MFAFDLALALGWVDVDAMLESISYPMFRQWMAYCEVRGPFNMERDDWRFGNVIAQIANMKREKGKKAYEPKQFMPQFGKQKKRFQSVDEMQAVMKKMRQVAPPRPQGEPNG